MRSLGVLKVVIATSALSLIAVLLSPATAAPAAQLVTCVDLASGKERIPRTGTCRTSHEATAKWHLAQSDSAVPSGSTTKSLTVCSNKESSPVTYQRIRTSCYKHMQTNLYTRSAALPAKPVITQASSYNSDSASLALATDPVANLDAPIAYYTITSSKGDVKKVNSLRELIVTVSGLHSSTSYTFTISATSVDGTSPVSSSSLPVTTQRYVAPVAAATSAPLAVPVFALSARAETSSVFTAATGFSISSSSGGAIASFAISATPAGMSFDTSTGALSGTPNTIAAATTYTITATNAAGTATQLFTLTTISRIGTTGPGGGVIFYEVATPFACGPTRANTCKYLEAAPSGWNTGSDPQRQWATGGNGFGNADNTVANLSSPETATATEIGWGYFNTRAIMHQGNTDTTIVAAALVDAYSVTIGGTVVADWYLPSKDELNEMYLERLKITGFEADSYWSSSESVSFGAWVRDFSTGAINGYPKFAPRWVRPIRAF